VDARLLSVYYAVRWIQQVNPWPQHASPRVGAEAAGVHNGGSGSLE
jgi:hypothetical protein